MIYRIKNQGKSRAESGRMEYEQFTGKEPFLLKVGLEKSI
jgi:hypothetical protein